MTAAVFYNDKMLMLTAVSGCARRQGRLSRRCGPPLQSVAPAVHGPSGPTTRRLALAEVGLVTGLAVCLQNCHACALAVCEQNCHACAPQRSTQVMALVLSTILYGAALFVGGVMGFVVRGRSFRKCAAKLAVCTPRARSEEGVDGIAGAWGSSWNYVHCDRRAAAWTVPTNQRAGSDGAHAASDGSRCGSGALGVPVWCL